MLKVMCRLKENLKKYKEEKRQQVSNQIFGGIVTASYVKHAEEGELKFIWFYIYHNVSFVSKNRTNDVPKTTPGYGTELFYPNSC